MVVEDKHTFVLAGRFSGTTQEQIRQQLWMWHYNPCISGANYLIIPNASYGVPAELMHLNGNASVMTWESVYDQLKTWFDKHPSEKRLGTWNGEYTLGDKFHN
jgi:hypothetical protein